VARNNKGRDFFHPFPTSTLLFAWNFSSKTKARICMKSGEETFNNRNGAQHAYFILIRSEIQYANLAQICQPPSQQKQGIDKRIKTRRSGNKVKTNKKIHPK
jgi:hypothetical protein